ncbi:Gfo/Idh/MocA family protein [Viscerimonas tarda]
MVTRRNFLKTAAMASAGLAAGGLDLSAVGSANQKNVANAGRRVNVAFVGIGHRGEQVLESVERTQLANIVALCDVDMGAPHTQKSIAKYPNVRQFQDFRKMFDAMAKDIEAVFVCTPDFAHFPISMLAMSLGKHVYVEKPMARTFLEVELMMQAARKYNVVTQVGNQGHSDANYFQFKAWKDAGIIKNVTAVTAHMNGSRRWHGFDPNIYKYPDADPKPATLDWDTWLSAAKYHDYSKKYHEGEWRSWYDFGLGALGDWGAHIMDTVHEFLELGLPYEVNPLKIVGHNDYFYPLASTLQFRFPQRAGMPPLDITWYDGVGNEPELPKGYGASELAANIPAAGNTGKIKKAELNPGKIIYSKDLTFKGGSHGSTLSIIPEEKAKEMASKLPEVPKSPSDHFANFLLSCQGLEATRSPFEIHGPLAQTFALGTIAQQLNVKLEFDRRLKQITNNEFANALLAGTPPRKGWEQFYKL